MQKTWNCQEYSIDCWPFWQFEENISIMNEEAEREEKDRKKQEQEQNKSTPNFNPSSYMSNMNNMMNKFK